MLDYPARLLSMCSCFPPEPFLVAASLAPPDLPAQLRHNSKQLLAPERPARVGTLSVLTTGEGDATTYGPWYLKPREVK